MGSSDSGARPNAFPSGTRRRDRLQPVLAVLSPVLSLSARAIDGVMAVAIAPACASCGATLDSPLAGPVCDICWRGISPLPLPWRPAKPTSLDSGLAAAIYDGPLRDIIHAWKYERRQGLSRPLAALVRARCGEALAGADVAVAVPMTPWRRWRRGFNQADDLARGLGLPVARPLARWRPRPTQASLPLHLRQRNLATSITVRRRWRARLAGARVVLVDDVVTTGATLEACATALKQAGAAEVRAVTVARTLLKA